MDHRDWADTGALGDRYVLRDRVGSGGSTTVYTADDVRLERRVAVKLFHTLPDEDGLAVFAAEAQVLAGLSHPGLVTVYDVNLAADRPYIVMRLIIGGTLSQLSQRQDIEPAAVARLGAQIAEVLAYVHERGVVHGNLDATNVLIDEQGDANLTGFGVDRGLGRPSGDVYALGMTLAECLPFDLGGEWRAVLTMMTDRDPDARPDAVRCAEVLRNIAAGDTTDIPLPQLEPGPAAPPATRVKPATKWKRPAYTGVAGMGLTFAALAVVVATATSGTPGGQQGEQQKPPRVEQPAEEPSVKPPAQTYPPPAESAAPTKPPKPTPSEPDRSAPEPPPGQDDGPGNGPGRGDGDDDGNNGRGDGDDNGNGEGNGEGNGDDEDKGLLGELLDGLG